VAIPLRGCLSAFAALALLSAPAVRADVVDGGAPPDAAPVGAAAGAGADADAGAAGSDGGAAMPPALATPPELAAPTTSASVTTTPPLIDAPTPAQAEPPRPITRRLWFWMAVTGVIVGASIVVIAVKNPSVSRPDCPAGYTCPL